MIATFVFSVNLFFLSAKLFVYLNSSGLFNLGNSYNLSFFPDFH